MHSVQIEWINQVADGVWNGVSERLDKGADENL